MVEIYIDADACPVKDETVRVATRHGLKTFMVCGGYLAHNLKVVGSNPTPVTNNINGLAIVRQAVFVCRAIPL